MISDRKRASKSTFEQYSHSLWGPPASGELLKPYPQRHYKKTSLLHEIDHIFAVAI